MKQMRITPINIAMGGILTWWAWGVLENHFLLSRFVWLLTLIIVLAIADQLFRGTIKNIRRIWWIQIGFLLLVLAITWIVRAI